MNTMMQRIALTALAFFATPLGASAATYKLLAPFGSILSGEVTLGQYLGGIMLVIVGIAGVLAVVMIVICGIKLMGGESASERSAAKDCVRNAIFGVLLAGGSWILLNTINSDLLKNTFVLGDLPVVAPSAAPVPAGNYAWSASGTCDPIPGMIVSAAPPSFCPGAGGAGAVCCTSTPSPLNPPSASPGAPPAPAWSFPPAAPPLTGGGGPGGFPPPIMPPPPGPPAPRPPTPPAGPGGDTLSPTLSIKKPYVPGYVVTNGSLDLTYVTSEETLMGSVTITIVNIVSGAVVQTTVRCSAAATPCPALGLNETTTVNVSTIPSGNYSAMITSCDAAGNCRKASVPIGILAGCTPGNPACKTDYNALLICVNQAIAGSCARADLNGDGVINSTDLGLLASASLYDINKDGVVDPTTLATNWGDTCFFYTAQDALLPCALRVLGDITITTADKTNFEAMFVASQPGPTQVNLALLNTNLCSRFPCTTPGLGLGGTNQLSIYGEAMFSTLSTYDFNGDGVVDWGFSSPDMLYFNACLKTPLDPLCVKADINRDSYITPSDLNMIMNLQAAWRGGTSLLSDMERTFWDGVFQPEAGILSVCEKALTPLVLLCGAADFNKSGKVDAADLTYLQGATKYDVNGDGVVIYNSTPLVPVRITATPPATLSTKFKNGDRVEAMTSINVRAAAGNAATFLGTVLSLGQGTITGGPVFADGNWWWRASFDSGLSGWVTEPTIRIALGPPPPPPPPPPPGLSTKFWMGDIVGSTANLTIRTSASIGGAVVGTIPPNTTRGTIIGGPVSADGYWWWQVRWDSGLTGWSAQDWMKEFTPPPAPVITFPRNNGYSSSTPVVVRGTMPAREVGGTVTIWRNSDTIVVGNGTIDSAGLWTVSGTLPDGTYTVGAVAMDQSQNYGPTSTRITFTVDTIPPSLPVVTAPVATVVTSAVTLSGTGSEPGVMYIYEGTTLLGTTNTSGGTNAWTFTRTPVTNGWHTYTIIEHDLANNISPAKSHAVFVAVPPAAPVITTPINNSYRNTSAITIGGTGLTGNTVKVWRGLTLVGTAPVAGGAWSFPTTFVDGTYTINAVQFDAAIVTSATSTNITFTVDTIIPAPPVIITPTNGSVIATANVTLTGTASEPGTIYFYSGSVLGPLIGTAVTSGPGNAWTFTAPPVPNGAYTIAATEHDLAGNVSGAATVAITVDAPPPAPVILTPSGPYATVSVMPINGTGFTPGNTINLYSGSTLLGSTVVGATNAWSITPPAFTEGIWTLFATEMSVTLRVSPNSANKVFTVDTIPPPPPVTLGPVNGFVVPVASTTVQISGTGAVSGERILIYRNGVLIRTTTVSAGLTWTYSPTKPAAGAHTILVTETDAAGNISASSTPVTFTVP